jgi:predicted RNA-binding protein associated with RNAse of E/G family
VSGEEWAIKHPLVRVEKHKRPHGVVSAWNAYVIGDDSQGIWLHSPKDSIHHTRNGKRWVVPWNGVQLLPRHAPWWVAWFWDRPGSRWTAADVCTPAAFAERRWSYVDLELDPVGSEHGFDHLADQDEFDLAVQAGHISLGEASAAETAARDVQDAMSTCREPFATAGWLWLDHAASLGLPPTG